MSAIIPEKRFQALSRAELADAETTGGGILFEF
jgi:hypothetical protein